VPAVGPHSDLLLAPLRNSLERAKNPATQIMADYPLAQPAGSTGIYAIRLMCDSTEPEEAKRAAYALLALLTATPTECLRLT